MNRHEPAENNISCTIKLDGVTLAKLDGVPETDAYSEATRILQCYPKAVVTGAVQTEPDHSNPRPWREGETATIAEFVEAFGETGLFI